MPYYAIDDILSQVEVEGAIPITELQYRSALAAKLDPNKESLVVSGSLIVRDRAPTPGHSWVDGLWQPPPPTPEPTPPIPPLTPRQMNLMFLQIGMSEEDVTNQIIASATEPSAQAVALVEWRKATAYRRNHPLVIQMASDFGFTPEQMDTMWQYAIDNFGE